jgi:hypothetical protein
MQATLPYAYTERYATEGKRGSSDLVLVDFATVDVPEIPSSETETLAEWIGGSPDQGGSRPIPVECVTWNGYLHVPLIDFDTRLLASALPSQAGQTMKCGWACLNDILGQVPTTSAESIARHAAVGGRVATHRKRSGRLVDTNHDRCLSATRDSMANLVAIDGGLWRRVDDLRLRVSSFIRPGVCDVEAVPFGSSARILSSRQWETECTPHVRRYALWQLDFARRELPHLPFECRFEALDVTDGFHSSFDGHADFIARALLFAVNAVKPDIGSYSGDQLARWLTMRETAERYFAGAEKVVDETSVDVLEDFVKEQKFEFATYAKSLRQAIKATKGFSPIPPRAFENRTTDAVVMRR